MKPLYWILRIKWKFVVQTKNLFLFWEPQVDLFSHLFFILSIRSRDLRSWVLWLFQKLQILFMHELFFTYCFLKLKYLSEYTYTTIINFSFVSTNINSLTSISLMMSLLSSLFSSAQIIPLCLKNAFNQRCCLLVL